MNPVGLRARLDRIERKLDRVLSILERGSPRSGPPTVLDRALPMMLHEGGKWRIGDVPVSFDRGEYFICGIKRRLDRSDDYVCALARRYGWEVAPMDEAAEEIASRYRMFTFSREKAPGGTDG